MRRTLITLMSSVALVASASVHALVCGATVYSPVTLTADLACPTGDGLVIGADNIRIDLNGFKISSPDTVGTRGIRSAGFRGVKIVGPGRITGFGNSVWIDGGDNLEIRDVDAAGVSTVGPGYGVWLHNSSGSVVESSRVGTVNVSSDPGSSAHANRIVGNDAVAIHVHGCQTSGNEVAKNDIHPMMFQAVSVYDGAKGNQVAGNRIVSGSIYVGGSSDNVVEANTLVNTYSSTIFAGVMLVQEPSSCTGLAMLPASGNLVRGNAVIGARVGIAVLDGAFKNQVGNNKIYDQTVAGLHFSANATDNDGRRNGYANAPVDVVDLGSGNLWP